MITAIVLCGVAYLMGSLSSAIIVCKMLNLPDPRTQGSMNPGTTNVLRIGGKKPALITLSGDILKGFIPVLIAQLLDINSFYVGLIGISAFLGHLYPVFFKFQGGKGVATAFGVFLGLTPFAGVAMLIIWIVVASIFRYSSLAAIAAALSAPILVLFLKPVYLLPTVIIVVILLWKHLDNIKRLKAGTESKMNLS